MWISCLNIVYWNGCHCQLCRFRIFVSHHIVFAMKDVVHFVMEIDAERDCENQIRSQCN